MATLRELARIFDFAAIIKSHRAGSGEVAIKSITSLYKPWEVKCQGDCLISDVEAVTVKYKPEPPTAGEKGIQSNDLVVVNNPVLDRRAVVFHDKGFPPLDSYAMTVVDWLCGQAGCNNGQNCIFLRSQTANVTSA